MVKTLAGALVPLFAAGIVAPAQAAVERPPQFVAMAFDNCTELERWKELSEFAAEMNKGADRLHFTFFVSATNFIAYANRSVYQGPRQPRGYSPINFGGTADEVRQRVAYINDMRRKGHEIASHAVGHFDGRSWSAAEWSQELRSFRTILRDIAQINGLEATAGLDFPPAEVIGFRAPYLAKSPGLYVTLKDQGYRYDTSGSDEPNVWPAKKDGVWRFNLANLKLHGSRRGTISMDYNFLIAQSMGFSQPARHAEFREQMLQTYLAYFRANYTGNRAPVHIGHHFTNYQGGVYNQALKAFARMVCGLPEVRCVTYARLADFMDSLDAATLAAYNAGDFPRAAMPVIVSTDATAADAAVGREQDTAARGAGRARR